MRDRFLNPDKKFLHRRSRQDQAQLKSKRQVYLGV